MVLTGSVLYTWHYLPVPYTVRMRILCTGGGTGGTIAPLLAVAEQLKKQDPHAEILFLTTRNPVETQLIQSAGFASRPFPAGKWRRYADIRNIRDVFVIKFAFWKALWFLRKYRPEVVVSVGSFLSVPVVWAARLLGIPSVIHQQDLRPGLANRLMAPAATRITVAFAQTESAFAQSKVQHVGNPVRKSVFHGNAEAVRQELHLESDVPTLLVLGGSSGAAFFSTLLSESVTRLTRFCQIIHVLGRHGSILPLAHARYHAVEFFAEGLGNAYAAADLVLTRAGLSTLSELSALGKPTIVIPMPDTHQVENADMFAKHSAVVALDQISLRPEEFASTVEELLRNTAKTQSLATAMQALTKTDAAERLAEIVSSAARGTS